MTAPNSMTGFARRDGSFGDARWHWEVRSVNGRGLDLRLRLPPGYEALEPRVREATAKRLTRGSIAISLAVQRESAASDIRLNEAALGRVIAAIARVHDAALARGKPIELERPRPEGILAIRGVLEIAEPAETEADTEARLAAMMRDYEATLAALATARAGEGARLGAVITGQLVEIEAIVGRVAASPARSEAAVRRRLEDQLKRLTDVATGLDPARLHQEAALIATRIDIAEELARLTAHIAAARDLLASREPIGRKLDFLAQEFNREANTLCSKAADVEITRAGLDLKAVIDQLREQVQNIE